MDLCHLLGVAEITRPGTSVSCSLLTGMETSAVVPYPFYGLMYWVLSSSCQHKAVCTFSDLS